MAKVERRETVWKLRFCSNWGFTRPRNEDERSQFGTLQLAKDVLSDTSSDFPDSLSRETVWKVLGECDGDLRLAPWRARDTPRTCPTKNGFASARFFPSTPDKDAPGFTA